MKGLLWIARKISKFISSIDKLIICILDTFLNIHNVELELIDIENSEF